VHISDAQLAELDDIVERAASGAADDLVGADRAFHLGVARATRNPFIEEVCGLLWGRSADGGEEAAPVMAAAYRALPMAERLGQVVIALRAGKRDEARGYLTSAVEQLNLAAEAAAIAEARAVSQKLRDHVELLDRD
jgi:DNA-binding FadR family transcriptional regulator